MSETKSLMNREAIEKIKELANEKICLFCTYENEGIISRPMSTQAVDDDGTLWFFSQKGSDKNIQIRKEDKVYLMYMEPGKNQYLSLTGYGEVLVDRNKIDELWNSIAKAWFPEGKDDPSLTLIKVTPQTGHYWDTKNGKLVSMIKIAISALTGKPEYGGVEGDIAV